jgi:hypothetical protein
MAGRKRTWYTNIRNIAVSWSCLDRTTRRLLTVDTRHPLGVAMPDDWARFVLLTTYTDDGRRVETPMTPAEARTLSRRLAMRADFVEDANRTHNDGWTADAAREEA